MRLSPLIDDLVEALRCLPGVGPKSAQRIALHLLAHDREGGARIEKALGAVLEHVGHCERCQNFSETAVCSICSDPRRHHHQLCVVENPMDVVSFEQSGVYRGLYFVLQGHLSPLDGIGPSDLGLDRLVARFEGEEPVEELILATSTTVEGEATAQYIGHLATERGVKVTRIAHGVPMGGDLEYVDANTLAHALADRRQFSS